MTGHEAQAHPWFKLCEEEDHPEIELKKISSEVIERLKNFKGESTFKKAAMNLLVKTATEEEVHDLKAAFQAIDTDGTGMIGAQELRQILVSKKQNVSDSEISSIIDQMDYHDNKQINYSEFLAATINVQSFLTESRLKAVFNQFDTDSSGKITEENIVLAMQKLGREISQSEVLEMITKHDVNGDGALNFAEFKAIFFDNKELESH